MFWGIFDLMPQQGISQRGLLSSCYGFCYTLPFQPLSRGYLMTRSHKLVTAAFIMVSLALTACSVTRTDCIEKGAQEPALINLCRFSKWRFVPEANTCKYVSMYSLNYSWASENVVLCWGEDPRHPGMPTPNPIIQQANFDTAAPGYFAFLGAFAAAIIPFTVK
jgi:hypothetical protein